MAPFALRDMPCNHGMYNNITSLQAVVSYGKKPNEIFLQYYGFVDTSYKADFYTADLLEYVQQVQGIPQDRLTTLVTYPELLQAVESVSADSCLFWHTLKREQRVDESQSATEGLFAMTFSELDRQVKAWLLNKLAPPRVALSFLL